MWAKAVQLLAKWLLIPLIKEAGTAIASFVKEYIAKKQQEKLSQQIKKVTDQIETERNKPLEQINAQALRDLHTRLRDLSSKL